MTDLEIELLSMLTWWKIQKECLISLAFVILDTPKLSIKILQQIIYMIEYHRSSVNQKYLL